jgi:hypothetical protein
MNSADSILIERRRNLGGLSLIAASRGYRFLCVTDARCNPSTRLMMEAFGAEVHTITVPTPEGGLLGARLDFLRARLESDRRYVWLNQYVNPNNWKAHYRTTGAGDHQGVPEPGRAVRGRDVRHADGLRAARGSGTASSRRWDAVGSRPRRPTACLIPGWARRYDR